jgi:hypothetical protein
VRYQEGNQDDEWNAVEMKGVETLHDDAAFFD